MYHEHVHRTIENIKKYNDMLISLHQFNAQSNLPVIKYTEKTVLMKIKYVTVV